MLKPFYHSNLWMQSPAAQRRLFWWDRTWPYRAKVWTFNIIKPVLCQGLIYQKSRLSTVHTLSYSTYYVGPELVSHDSLLSLFVRLNGRVSHECEPQFKKKNTTLFGPFVNRLLLVLKFFFDFRMKLTQNGLYFCICCCLPCKIVIDRNFWKTICMLFKGRDGGRGRGQLLPRTQGRVDEVGQQEHHPTKRQPACN